MVCLHELTVHTWKECILPLLGKMAYKYQLGQGGWYRLFSFRKKIKCLIAWGIELNMVNSYTRLFYCWILRNNFTLLTFSNWGNALISSTKLTFTASFQHLFQSRWGWLDTIINTNVHASHKATFIVRTLEVSQHLMTQLS